MAKTNKTEYALLGLLAMGPKSGYDIKKDADTMLRHFWHESFGQIYPRLNRLHEKGFVEKDEEVQEGKPNRYVYTLTEAGYKALDEWLGKPAERMRPRNELLLKLFFGWFTDAASLLDVLAAYKEQRQSMLQTLEAISTQLEREARAEPDYRYWMLTLDFGKRALHTQLEWTADAMAQLSELADASA